MQQTKSLRILRAKLIGLSALIFAFFVPAFAASAATYIFDFSATDINISGLMTVEDALVDGSTTGHNVLSFDGTVNSTGCTLGCGSVALVSNPSAPDFTADAISGFYYDNILYYPPDLPGGYFDANGILLRSGDYSYLFYIQAVIDPMQVGILDVQLDPIVDFNLTLTETPLPGALPLFAGGLGALGLLGWRRKRSAPVTAT